MKVSVSTVVRRKKKQWMVRHKPPGGKRIRRFFKSKASADRAAAHPKAEFETVGTEWAAMDPVKRTELQTIDREITEAGLTIRQVWEDYRRLSKPKTRQTASLALEQCLAEKQSANRRPAYLANLRVIVSMFIRGREMMDVAEFTAEDVKAFLPVTLKPSSRASRLGRLTAWFSYCKFQSWITENPCDRVQGISVELTTPSTLSVTQSRDVLSAFRRHAPEGLAWLVLGLFAGLRPTEAERMEWSDIDLDRAVVTVDAAASKVRRRRQVRLEPAAVEWLFVAKIRSQLPISAGVRRAACDRVRGILGWKEWPQDVLRHTAASQLVELRQDVAGVALQLGNSQSVLLTYYKDVVTPEDCAEFWKILPEPQ